MKVLWLASWYPNRTNPTSGDFIERHAKAVAAQVSSVVVIAVIKDEQMKAGEVEIIKTTDNNLTVYIAYYGKSKWGGVIEKLLSVRTYLSIQQKIYKEAFPKEKPAIVHVQVAMKAGLFARQLKRRLAIPYIITEHWAGYYKACIPNIYDKGKQFIRLTNKVFRDANLFCPVSDDLGKLINEDFTKVNYEVVYNVVNTKLFYYQQSQSVEKCRFTHPSYLNFQKNPEGILKACKIVKEKGYDFELLMIGNKDEKLMKIAAANDLLDKQVFFKGAVPYTDVAKEMQHSSALLLFSRFENLPCVISEALCCGLPVISTRVGGIAEIIDDSNGLLVENENIDQLVTAMEKMINSFNQYDRKAIAVKAAAMFNYETIGRQYADIYRKIMDNGIIDNG